MPNDEPGPIHGLRGHEGGHRRCIPPAVPGRAKASQTDSAERLKGPNASYGAARLPDRR